MRRERGSTDRGVNGARGWSHLVALEVSDAEGARPHSIIKLVHMCFASSTAKAGRCASEGLCRDVAHDVVGAVPPVHAPKPEPRVVCPCLDRCHAPRLAVAKGTQVQTRWPKKEELIRYLY